MEDSLDTFGGRTIKTLLFMYLFLLAAAAAAADCPIPQGKKQFVLTNEALLKNDFPDGSEVTFECVNGYVREDGSGTVTCIAGTWTEPDLRCKKKDCGRPRDQVHMSFEFSKNDTLFGATAKVICEKGYQLRGTAYKRCYAAGWSGRSKCEVVTCNKPDEVTNGRTSWDSDTTPIYGEVIQYFCDEGYTLTGNDTIVCSEHGDYSSRPPECKGGTSVLTTEDTITTKMVTPTPTVRGGKNVLTTVENFLLTEASTTTESTGTPTTHRDKLITTCSTSADSPSLRDGRDIVTAEDKITTTGITTTAAPPVRGKHGDVDTNKDVGYTPVIVSVISTSIVVLIVAFIIHKLLLKRKGSYDTGEDLKPELLQFQSL